MFDYNQIFSLGDRKYRLASVLSGEDVHVMSLEDALAHANEIDACDKSEFDYIVDVITKGKMMFDRHSKYQHYKSRYPLLQMLPIPHSTDITKLVLAFRTDQDTLLSMYLSPMSSYAIADEEWSPRRWAGPGPRCSFPNGYLNGFRAHFLVRVED